MNNKKINTAKLTNELDDPQIRLVKAFENDNLEEFQYVLTIGGNPMAIDDQYFNIYEKALQKPGAVKFVKECLKYGCDPNHINDYYNKAAITYATDSRDPAILQALLTEPDVQVNFVYSSLTPLNSLAKNITANNFDDCYECMKILVEHEASINKPDQREMTPLHNIVKNQNITDAQKYRLVQWFLKMPNIDIDTYREGELRRTLEMEYPALQLPAKSQTPKITFQTLLNLIRADDMETFAEQYNDETRCTSKEEDVDLFIVSIQREAQKAFDLLLENGVEYNREDRKKTPIQIALVWGNSYALKRLLQQPDIIIPQKTYDHPLSYIVRKLSDDNYRNNSNYWNCFNVLLDSDKIDINTTDYSKSTALHYAVRYRNNRAIRELLKRGAGICIENVFHELPLHGMKAFILEEHLDDCISSNDANYGDKDYEIIIDFKNFILPNQSNEKQNAILTPISFMSKTKELRHLLQHPVITSILYLKWHKLQMIFYMNFLFYLFFAISMITFSVLRFRESEFQIDLVRDVAQYCSWLGICYLICREFLQFILSPLNYFFNFSNYVEILLIICSIITSCDNVVKIPTDTQRNIGVVCILLLAYELVLLIGALPVSSISTHMLMLTTVCKSFIKIFMLYSIFIITFTLCFYIKNDSKKTNTVQNDSDKTDTVESKTDTAEDAFHKFSNPLSAFAKIIVMFTGEFDASSLELDSNYWLFLAFVFFMTIILFNLLNGLAVSDTQVIKDQAELNEIICRINLLAHYEKTAFKQTSCGLYLTKRQPFRFICNAFKKLFPTYTTDVQVTIWPNDKNRIKTLKSQNKAKSIKILNLINVNEKGNETEEAQIILYNDEDDAEEEDYAAQNKLLKCYYWLIMKIFARIDKRTVTMARAVLEKKSIPTIESRLEGMEGKLNNTEDKLSNMDGKLNTMEEKLSNILKALKG